MFYQPQITTILKSDGWHFRCIDRTGDEITSKDSFLDAREALDAGYVWRDAAYPAPKGLTVEVSV